MGGGDEPGRQADRVLVARVRCDQCGREHYSAAVPRLGRVPHCQECGAPQRVVELIDDEGPAPD